MVSFIISMNIDLFSTISKQFQDGHPVVDDRRDRIAPNIKSFQTGQTVQILHFGDLKIIRNKQNFKDLHLFYIICIELDVCFSVNLTSLLLG